MEELERVRTELLDRAAALETAVAAAELRADAERRRADAEALIRAANPNADVAP